MLQCCVASVLLVGPAWHRPLDGHPDKVHIAGAVNAAEAIPLDDAPRGYAELDSGATTTYLLNPDGYVAA